MMRRAVLIGSPLPVSTRNHLWGVKKDIDNYQHFLMSANGGGWKSSEILVMDDPSVLEVQSAKFFCKGADYSMIIFSGHGCMKRGKNYLQINAYSNIDSDNLITTCAKQCIIMDACRTMCATEDFQGIYGLDIEFRQEYSNISRKLFDTAIEVTPKGLVKIFSTSANSYASDMRDGGLFTVSLLTAIDDWLKETPKLCLSIDQALSMTKKILNRNLKPQVPTKELSRQDMAILPFATNPLPLVAQLRDKYMNDPRLSRHEIELRLNALKTLHLN